MQPGRWGWGGGRMCAHNMGMNGWMDLDVKGDSTKKQKTKNLTIVKEKKKSKYTMTKINKKLNIFLAGRGRLHCGTSL